MSSTPPPRIQRRIGGLEQTSKGTKRKHIISLSKTLMDDDHGCHKKLPVFCMGIDPLDGG